MSLVLLVFPATLLWNLQKGHLLEKSLVRAALYFRAPVTLQMPPQPHVTSSAWPLRSFLYPSFSPKEVLQSLLETHY